MSLTGKSRKSKALFFFLNEIADKFDALALKRVVDYLFVFSEKILIHFPGFIHLYITYYDDIIDHEITIANISQKARILHVGCGSIPASSILLAQKTKGFILGIDKDDYAIKQAKKFISNSNQSEHLEIKKGGPLDFDLCLFDVILISQGIVPKKQVLKALSTKITDEQIIILRSFSASSTIDEQDLFLSEYYTIQHVYQHTIHGSTISIFLKKKHI